MTEEPRYDDNTSLPVDFGDDESDSQDIVPQPSQPGCSLKTDEVEDQQDDLTLSEPEDWTDILEEISDPTVESPEVKEEPAVIHSELSAIDDALTDELPQLDEGVPAPKEDEPDNIETDLIEQIEVGVASKIDADEIDDDVDDTAPSDDEDTNISDVAVEEDENIEPLLADEGEDAADSADDDIDEDEIDLDEPFYIAAKTVGVENPEALFDESSGKVETIIMEGEIIRSEVDKERIAAEHRTGSELENPATLIDTSAMNLGKFWGRQHSYDPPSILIGAVIVGLALVLVGQFVHNHRQSLATYGAFGATIAPVYRLLGRPVTPNWEVNGWQFEATNGSINDDNTRLTIVSRIANRSNQFLPYPLVHVELTDRFDDITGSAILKLSDYMAVDGDKDRPIAPGDNFTATIAIDDPSTKVYGYRLKLCYLTEPGAFRCAAEAFRD